MISDTSFPKYSEKKIVQLHVNCNKTVKIHKITHSQGTYQMQKEQYPMKWA